GDLDVVAGSDAELVWFSNHGDFTLEPIASEVGAVRSIAIGDLDGDGDADVVSARDSGIYWDANALPDSSWDEHPIDAGLSGGRSVAVADLDHDGDLDVLCAAAHDGTYAWFENKDGHGTFGERRPIAGFSAEPTVVRPADLDRDGDPDVVTAAA